MKRAVYAIGIAAALAVLAGAWFLTAYERVETRVWTGPSPAARANPYLAAMRFLERVGVGSSLAVNADELGKLPPGSALLLPARRGGISPPHARALRQWIENGGHAIVEPEPGSEVDPVLDQFGIRRSGPERPPAAPTVAAQLPGMAAPLTVSNMPAPALRFEGITPEVTLAGKDGAWFASMAIGAGRLTVMGGMRRFHNRAIGAHDNAELLSRVVALPPAAAHLVILRMPSELPLWSWLRERALPAVAAAAVLLLLWLARTLPRLGPVQPEATAQRRQLREHILAAGRYRWTHGGRAGLLAAARELCHRHLAQRFPRIAQLPLPQRCEALSARTGIDAAALAAAFAGEARTTREFVHIVGTLASIHSKTSRHADRNTMRRQPSS
jgi:hypothetical protein